MPSIVQSTPANYIRNSSDCVSRVVRWSDKIIKEQPSTMPHIPESFLEHRQVFANPWIEQWVLPNPFISALHNALRGYDVLLTDFSFTKEAANLGETSLNVAIRTLDAAVKIGLDSIVFSAANPDWGDASNLTAVFERCAEAVREIVRASPSWQEATLLLHLVDESADLRAATANLVNTALIGDASFYGISIHRTSGPLLIEKSLRYDNAVFLRIQHKFSGAESLAAIAAKIYEDEVFSLGLLGLVDPDQARLS